MRVYRDTKGNRWSVPCLFEIDEFMTLEEREKLEEKLLPEHTPGEPAVVSLSAQPLPGDYVEPGDALCLQFIDSYEKAGTLEGIIEANPEPERFRKWVEVLKERYK